MRLVHVCHIGAADVYPPVGWSEQRTGDGKKSRFAGTGRSHDSNDLAAANIERDVVQSCNAEVAGAINLADALQLKDQRWRALHRAIP